MNIEITKEQATIFEALLIENRDSAKLQKASNCSYLESINILNEIRAKAANAINTEIRVYFVNADDADNDNLEFHAATEEEIVDYCEGKGNVYTLTSFEEDINNGDLELCNSYIKIVEVETQADKNDFAKLPVIKLNYSI